MVARKVFEACSHLAVSMVQCFSQSRSIPFWEARSPRTRSESSVASSRRCGRSILLLLLHRNQKYFPAASFKSHSVWWCRGDLTLSHMLASNHRVHVMNSASRVKMRSFCLMWVAPLEKPYGRVTLGRHRTLTKTSRRGKFVILRYIEHIISTLMVIGFQCPAYLVLFIF